MARGKILCLCQSQLKLTGLKGNASCGQIRAQGEESMKNRVAKVVTTQQRRSKESIMKKPKIITNLKIWFVGLIRLL